MLSVVRCRAVSTRRNPSDGGLISRPNSEDALARSLKRDRECTHISAAPTFVGQGRILPYELEFHCAPDPRAGELGSSGRSTSSGHRGAAWDAASRTGAASTSIDVCATSKSRHSNTKAIGPAGGNGSHQNSWDHLRPPPRPPLGWRDRTDVFALGIEFHRLIALDPSANPIPKRSSPPVESFRPPIPGRRKPSGDGAGLSRLIATSEKAKPVG